MKKISFIAAASLFVGGCYYDNKEDLYPSVIACDTSAVTYSGRVVSIIQANCYSCHSSSTQLGNVTLEGFSNLKIYADNGKLINVIEHQAGFPSMPQGASKLNDCDIAVIRKWVSDGSVNN